MNKVRSIIFFSTPNRGGSGSDGLSSLLKLVGMSKEYIKDLIASSSLLSSINDDFTNTCGNLQLFSFYETLKTYTPTGSQYVSNKRVRCSIADALKIVNKNSAILNLPNEISKPVAADHSNVCKFKTKDDTGYKDIRNVLINLVFHNTSKGTFPT